MRPLNIVRSHLRRCQFNFSKMTMIQFLVSVAADTIYLLADVLMFQNAQILSILTSVI